MVSGAPERIRVVGPALEQVGFEVIGVDDPAVLPELCAGLGPEALDCYLQLPLEILPAKGGAVERVADFLVKGLVARFAAAATVLPVLRPGANVVLVAGHQPSCDLPDDRRARRDLLGVLARAVIGETAPAGVRTVLVGSEHSPADLAAIAADTGPVQWPDHSTYAALAPGGSYDDWRRDALSLPTPDLRSWRHQPDPDDYDW
jgi:hypothetical protein